MVASKFPPYYTPTPGVLNKDNWRDKCAEKRQKRDELIPAEWRFDTAKYDGLKDVRGVPARCGILSEREIEVTEIDDAAELCARIAKGTYTSYEVTLAMCKRAAIAQQLVNCCTELFFDRALKRAKELDEHLRKTGETVGPFHGLPISLKDQFDVEGTELTMGYAAWLGRISPVSCSLVRLLEAAGAVVYVRTNVPQTLMIGDTDNHVFGRTWNPCDRTRSPGGSSGGEGALIALKGSILGVGTDIGGSVRFPSAFCGLHTIRPSTRRVPYGRASNSLLGQDFLLSVCGPMARSMETCVFFMRTVLGIASDFDATAMPFRFDEGMYTEVQKQDKLAFGVMRTDGHVPPMPALVRVIDETVAKLRAVGHTVVEFDAAQFNRAYEVGLEIFDADGGEDVKRVIDPIGEPLIPNLALSPGGGVSVYELFQLNREKEALQQAFLDAWMATQAATGTGRPIDGLISPAVATVATLPGENEHAGYTMMFNALDLPATVWPVSTVDPSKDAMPSPPPSAINDLHQRYLDRYDAEQLKGLPITLQLVGRRWRDEALLSLTQRVQQILAQ